MEQPSRRAYLIDPKTRTISVVTAPLEQDGRVGLIPLTPEGDSLRIEPHSPFENDVYAFIFNPLGLQLGRSLVLGPPGKDPTLPLATIARHITWVAAMMVCGGITSIIPSTKGTIL